jgi:hypothetical protein
MKALDLIATSLNRRDDEPNQALAVEIISNKRNEWVKELVDNLSHKNKDIQSDCIKVLYEIGERGSAGLITPYIKAFSNLLEGKNNRLIWGAMAALDTISSVDAVNVFNELPIILKAIDNGSVITIDHGVGLLAKLSAIPEFATTAFPLLIEQLRKCPPKQLPMYAEKSVIAINTANQQEFVSLIQSRLAEMDKDSQVTRLNKILKKLKK